MIALSFIWDHERTVYGRNRDSSKTLRWSGGFRSGPRRSEATWLCNVCGWIGPERHIHRFAIDDPSTEYSADEPWERS